MKFKILTICFLATFFGSLQAQQLLNFLDRSGNGVLERNRLEKKDSKITGSPYSVEKFMPADIDGAGEMVMVRYNLHADEVEIEYGEKILTLPKKAEFSKVVQRNGKALLLMNYRDVRGADIYGYLFEVYAGKKINLYLKERSIVIPEKQPQNGYGTYSPARYSRTDDEYYFNHNGSVVAFPEKKKDLISLFPEKKKEIEAFLKANKLKFKSEEDLIKIATFLDNM